MDKLELISFRALSMGFLGMFLLSLETIRFFRRSSRWLKVEGYVDSLSYDKGENPTATIVYSIGDPIITRRAVVPRTDTMGLGGGVTVEYDPGNPDRSRVYNPTLDVIRFIGYGIAAAFLIFLGFSARTL